MDHELSSFAQDLWHDHPAIVVLFIGALILFVLLVVDTHRHRKKHKHERHRIKH